MLGNVLDLSHDVDELVDADQVLPKGIEQTVYRKRLPGLTGRKMWWRSLGSTCCIQGSQKNQEKKKHTNQKNLVQFVITAGLIEFDLVKRIYSC